MGHKPQTRLLIGLGAAAAAFGVAAMMSAVSAPTARADDYSDIIAQVESDFSDGSTAFTAAEASFASNPETGLEYLFAGINDDFLSAPQDFLVGSSEAANNLTLAFPGGEWGFDPVASITAGFNDAAGDLSSASSFATQVGEELAAGDYGYAAYEGVLAADYSTIVPLEEILLGAVGSL
jgi:hypothetical protein